MLSAPLLTTERLVLRALRFEDFQPLVDLFATERSRYMDGPQSPAQVWSGFMESVGQWPILGYGSWAVTLRESGELVGQCGLNRPYSFPEDELGWLLLDGFEGHGYAFEAAIAARDFGYRQIGMKTLVSYIDPDNTRSIRLAGRLGARLDTSAPTPNGDACLVFRHARG